MSQFKSRIESFTSTPDSRDALDKVMKKQQQFNKSETIRRCILDYATRQDKKSLKNQKA